MYFTNAFKAIKNSKWLSLIITVQLVIAFFTLITGLVLFQQSLSQVIKFQSMFNEKKTLYVSTPASNMVQALDSNEVGSIIDFYKSMVADENIETIGSGSIGRSNWDEISDLQSITNGEVEGLSNTIYVDENFYKYFNRIKLIDGRGFISEDFNKNDEDSIPIIVSKDLEKYLPVGKHYDKYEVVGVLSEDSNLYYSNMDSIYTGVTQKKYTIISSFSFEESLNRADLAYGILHGTMITLKDESLVGEYKKRISDELYNKVSLPVEVKGVSDYKSDYIKSVRGGIIATLGIAILLLVFSFFGIVGIILALLIRRKKEFGVKLALGWRFRDIYIQVFTEILLLSSISLIIAIAINLLLVRVERFEIIPSLYILVCVLSLALTSLYSIVPILKLKKMNIVELIKDVK